MDDLIPAGMGPGRAIALGVLQGLGEFLPISSSGHLIVVPWLLGWPDHGLAFDVALHMGTLLAVVYAFAGDWWRLLNGAARGLRQGRPFAAPAAISALSIRCQPAMSIDSGIGSGPLLGSRSRSQAMTRWATPWLSARLVGMVPDGPRRAQRLRRATNASQPSGSSATAPLQFSQTATRRVIRPCSCAEPSTSVPIGMTTPA